MSKRVLSELEQEKEQYTQLSSKRQRELKRKAFREIFESENASSFQVLRKSKDDDFNDYSGIDYEGYEDQLRKENSSTEIALEPFNLNRELAEGRFDDNGNYVETRNEDINDPWYQECLEREGYPKVGYGESSSSSSKLSVKKTSTKDETKEELPTDLISLKKLIVTYLQDGENVLKALRRLKGKPSEKQSSTPKEANTAFDLLTEAADLCLHNFSYFNIYSETKEEILASIQNETGERMPVLSYWEYKLTEDSEEIYGPFLTSDMLSWYTEGYFQGERVVFLRRVGSHEPFQPSDTVDFTVYL